VNFQIFDGPAPKQGALNSPPAGTSMGNGKGSGITPANPTASSANSATNAGQQNASITNQVIQAVESVMGAAPEPGDLNTLRQQGMSAYQHGDYAGALGTFRHVIAADPSDIVAYNVAGNCSMHLKDYPSAIGSFKHALQLVPDEYHNLGALTRAYTLAGMAPERDELRKHILELAHAGKLPDTFNYVFDTFDAGGKRVEVAEFPKIQGYYGERYRFMVFSSAGIEVFCVTLESDALEQPAWARQHPKEAAAGGRQFSLDGYASDAHTSYGFFDAEPGYEQVRDAATQIIAGKKQPISRLSYPSAQPIPGDKNQ